MTQQEMTAEQDAAARGLEHYPRWEVSAVMAGLACLWIDSAAAQVAAVVGIAVSYGTYRLHRS